MSHEGSYFVREDEHRFRPTPLTGGAWSTAEQHISPMNGLIVHAVERFVAERGGDALAIGRISVDILGVLDLEPFDLTVEVVRPGRTIELLEATVVSGGRPAVRARVWRTTVQDTAAVAGGAAEPLPGPEGLKVWPMTGVWPGAYVASLDVRQIGAAEPGRARAWGSTAATLVDGEHVSDLARLIGLVDTANGLAVRRPPEEWLFPNVDLTIHLFRTPSGPWLGLDTTVVFGPGGLGVTATALHDAEGHFGHAHQALTIRPRRA
ncbi:thioesterase family protein [Glycomyces paridis]|uniref:Thioesterase family protein n=1 Tax=Glycomyces paridis TaxID=2126555 RepID=A0A4S8PC68_9ACTN|nr:thioesterase family protein [Glycomyces paridis]THV27301.1 thioesterase family protein [Glycomyces paridis]